MNITILQQKLYEYFKKDIKNEKAKVFNLITMSENLEYAVKLVAANKGSVTAGVDGVTKLNFSKEDLVNITKQMRAGEYEPQPVRRVGIPKPDGGTRYLGIPTYSDRVAQAACNNIMSPILETKFRDFVIGFRPKRSVWHGLSNLRDLVTPRYQNNALRKTFRWAIINDIETAFDTVKKEQVMKTFQKVFNDNKLLSLIMSFMDSKVHYKNEVLEPYGTPQGGILSPLLFNMVMMPLDEWYYQNFSPLKYSGKLIKAFNQRRRNTDLGNVRYMRYADDPIFLTSGKFSMVSELTHGKWYDSFSQKTDPNNFDANLDRRNLNEVIESIGLSLSSNKAEVTHVHKGIDYLGVRTKGHRLKNNKYVVYQTPILKRLNRTKEKIRSITERRNISDGELVHTINNIIRGYAYFHRYGNNGRLFIQLNNFVFQRVFRHLEKKHNYGRKRVYSSYIRTVANPNYQRNKGLKPKVKRIVVLDESYNPPRELPLVDITTVKIIYLTWKIPFTNMGNPFEELTDEEKKIPEQVRNKYQKYGKTYYLARLGTLQRDNYNCAICQTPTRIEVHHIEPYPQTGSVSYAEQTKLNRLSNLITLCKYCHEDIHHNKLDITEAKKYVRQFKYFDSLSDDEENSILFG